MGVRTFSELMYDHASRISSLERRLRRSVRPTRGSTAERDLAFGSPSTDAHRVALANAQPIWFNTDLHYHQTYYTVSGKPGLMVPGLAAGFNSGWYAVPHLQWAGKSGPISFYSGYWNAWNKGAHGNGSAFNSQGDPGGIIIGLTGTYECWAHQRGSSASDYVALALSGDRATLQNRTGGIWTHDHSSGGNSFGNSHYIGTLFAGEMLTAGPPSAGGNIYGADGHVGIMTIRRVM